MSFEKRCLHSIILSKTEFQERASKLIISKLVITLRRHSVICPRFFAYFNAICIMFAFAYNDAISKVWSTESQNTFFVKLKPLAAAFSRPDGELSLLIFVYVMLTHASVWRRLHSNPFDFNSHLKNENKKKKNTIQSHSSNIDNNNMFFDYVLVCYLDHDRSCKSCNIFIYGYVFFLLLHLFDAKSFTSFEGVASNCVKISPQFSLSKKSIKRNRNSRRFCVPVHAIYGKPHEIPW